MNNESGAEAAAEKKAQMMRTMRKIWTGLILVFFVVILLNLYNWWSDGGNSLNLLKGILSPLGMICVGLSTIVAERSRQLSYVFLALGMILVVAALVVVIAY